MSHKHAIWLSMRRNIGYVRAKLLVEYFGSAENIYKASRRELADIEGIRPDMLSELMDKDLSIAEGIIENCAKTGCSILAIDDDEYPDRLLNIFDPPTVLYVKGKMPPVDDVPVVGIVGTRWCTPYGYKNAETLGHRLSENEITVTTGLARGIDTAAAIGALKGKKPVIGVIGCGIDRIYPVENRKLYKQVTENGAVISEYPPGTEARPEYFPMRNRIISGLSNGVVVIEAPERSGALITAQRALEQCRDVFVLPGNVDSRACIGSNKLLREGAIPFINAEDIIDEYRDLFNSAKKPIDNSTAVDYIDVSKFEEALSELNDIEKAIVGEIRQRAMFADEITEIIGMSPQVILASLTSLELTGIAKRDSIGKWEIT